MQTKAVIFDKDGTLLDFEAFWTPVGIAATQKVLRALRREDIPLEKVLAAIGIEEGSCSILGALCYGTYGDIAAKTREVLVAYGCDRPLEEVTALTVGAYHDSLSAGVIKPTCDNITDVMDFLKKNDIKVALVTADDPTVTAECLDALGIADYFDVLYTDDGTHPNKPDPYCINALCEKYGFEKSEVVMVGDTLTDMNFAQNGGLRAIGLAKTDANKATLLKKTDTVVPDISYLPQVLK